MAAKQSVFFVPAEVESTKSQLPILSSLRCAKLAELELVSRKVKLGHSDENDLVNAILAVFRYLDVYVGNGVLLHFSSSLSPEGLVLLTCTMSFRAIGCLNSCAADVKLYSSSLTQDSKHLLAREVAKIDTSQSKELDGLKCQLSAHQVCQSKRFSVPQISMVVLVIIKCKFLMESTPDDMGADTSFNSPVCLC